MMSDGTGSIRNQKHPHLTARHKHSSQSKPANCLCGRSQSGLYWSGRGQRRGVRWVDVRADVSGPGGRHPWYGWRGREGAPGLPQNHLDTKNVIKIKERRGRERKEGREREGGKRGEREEREGRDREEREEREREGKRGERERL